MRLRIVKWLVLVVCLSSPLAHATKYYKWVDKDGHIFYDERPPNQDGYKVEEKNLGSRANADATAIPPEVLDKFPVVLYTAPKCASCDSARSYLKGRGVPFTEKNVDGNRELQNELIKKTGGLAVPTIMVGSKVMNGYLESLLEGELDQAGYPNPKKSAQAENNDSDDTSSPEARKQDKEP